MNKHVHKRVSRFVRFLKDLTPLELDQAISHLESQLGARDEPVLIRIPEDHVNVHEARSFDVVEWSDNPEARIRRAAWLS